MATYLQDGENRETSEQDSDEPAPADRDAAVEAELEDGKKEADDGTGADVVSLDAFRKKN